MATAFETTVRSGLAALAFIAASAGEVEAKSRRVHAPDAINNATDADVQKLVCSNQKGTSVDGNGNQRFPKDPPGVHILREWKNCQIHIVDTQCQFQWKELPPPGKYRTREANGKTFYCPLEKDPTGQYPSSSLEQPVRFGPELKAASVKVGFSFNAG